MNVTDEPSVLAVCLPGLQEDAGIVGLDVSSVGSGREAIELLRMLRFDLMLLGTELPDMPATAFLRRVRMAWPWLKSAVVCAADLTEQQEREARALGVVGILESWALCEQLPRVVGSLGPREARSVGSPHHHRAKVR